MTALRKVTTAAVLGAAPLLLTGLTAGTASAHGSMESPVSRVLTCYAEGPEAPKTPACKAAIGANGPQPFYDWSAVNIADAGGKSKEIIPDGKLCSANKPDYSGLDQARTDWPATKVSAGKFTFTYKAPAPHKGYFELYITKEGYDPAKPLKWSDLEEKPFLKVEDPTLENGSYVFEGDIPQRSGRQMIYSVWQRTDSQEAFYTCSDVDFGGGSSSGGTTAPAEDASSAPSAAPSTTEPSAAPEASAPTDEQLADGADKSTVDHEHMDHGDHQEQADGAAPQMGGKHLAETGGDSSTAPLAATGAAILALGAGATVFARRRSAAARRR
jgi:chitin-binding protein